MAVANAEETLGSIQKEDAASDLSGEAEQEEYPGQRSLVGTEPQGGTGNKSDVPESHGADLPAEISGDKGLGESKAGQSVPKETTAGEGAAGITSSEDELSVSVAGVLFVVSAALIVVVNRQGKGRRRRR